MLNRWTNPSSDQNIEEMHEISLVRNIFRSLEAQFPPEELAGLSRIHLKVGLLANVEPLLLQNAFDAVLETEKQEHRNVLLSVDLVPIQIECPVCSAISTINDYKFRCASCDTPTNNIISGTELLIAGVDFERSPLG